MASSSPLFDKTMHLRARWVRADYSAGAFAVGAVSAYVAGRSSFAGRAITSPHGAADIAFTGIAVPQSVTLDREEIWLLADRLERKPDGDYRRNAGHMPRVATHLDAALPWGVGDEAARRIVEGFSRWVVDTYGVAVEYAAHNKEKPLDHAHFLIGTRVLAENGFGKKVRALNGIAQQHADRAAGKEIAHARGDGTIKRVSSAMDEIRARWAELVAVEIGHAVDHRSYERRGVDIVPVPRVRRGEIEFQKRVERRTGASPEWRKDRARRMAARAGTPLMTNGVAKVATLNLKTNSVTLAARRQRKRVKSASAPTASAEVAARHLSSLRQDITHREFAPIGDLLETGRRLDAEETTKGQRAIGEMGTARTESGAHPKADTIQRRWRERAIDVSDNNLSCRVSLIKQQRHSKDALGHKQRLILVLVEKLTGVDALVALHRLAECARRFAQDWKKLTSVHDEQWLNLFAAQRAAWRAAMQEEIVPAHAAERETDRPSRGSVMSTGDATGRRPRKRREMGTAAPTTQVVATAYLVSLRHQFSKTFANQRASWRIRANAADADRIARGRVEIKSSFERAAQTQMVNTTALIAAVSNIATTAISGWHERVQSALIEQRRARQTLLLAQEQDEAKMRRRQRLALVLMEQLVLKDAMLALHHMVVAAKNFAREANGLLDRQGQDWIDLVAAQRKAWPDLPYPQVDQAEPQTGTRHAVSAAPGSSDHPTALANTLDAVAVAAPPLPSSPRTTHATRRPLAHIRIAEELADWLILKHRSSVGHNRMLANFVGEPPDAFDVRARRRSQKNLDQSKELGPGQQSLWAPRTAKELLDDPIVKASPDLRDLIMQVGSRPKPPAAAREREAGAAGTARRPTAKAMSKDDDRKGRK